LDELKPHPFGPELERPVLIGDLDHDLAHTSDHLVPPSSIPVERVRERRGLKLGHRIPRKFIALSGHHRQRRVAASGQGRVLARVDPAQSDTLVATTNARLMEMRGRQMQGWLRVGAEDLRSKRELATWVELGTTYARSLPAKR
jgi:hypothetical protein